MIEDEELHNEVAELRNAMEIIISLYENERASAWDLYSVACEVTGVKKTYTGQTSMTIHRMNDFMDGENVWVG